MSLTLDQNRIELLKIDIESILIDGILVIKLLKFFGDVYLNGQKPKNDCNMWLRQYHLRLKAKFKNEINGT